MMCAVSNCYHNSNNNQSHTETPASKKRFSFSPAKALLNKFAAVAKSTRSTNSKCSPAAVHTQLSRTRSLCKLPKFTPSGCTGAPTPSSIHIQQKSARRCDNHNNDFLSANQLTLYEEGRYPMLDQQLHQRPPTPRPKQNFSIGVGAEGDATPRLYKRPLSPLPLTVIPPLPVLQPIEPDFPNVNNKSKHSPRLPPLNNNNSSSSIISNSSNNNNNNANNRRNWWDGYRNVDIDSMTQQEYYMLLSQYRMPLTATNNNATFPNIKNG